MTGNAITVATWNIHKGVGTDRRRDLRRTAEVIGELGADIITLQEVDTRFGIRTGLLDLQALRRDHGLHAVGVSGDTPAHGWHGNLILVRDAEVQEVYRIALPGLEPRGAVMADLRVGGRALRVIGAHLGLLAASRTAQAGEILEQLAAVDDRPALLMGDLNEWRAGEATSLGPLARHFLSQVAVPSFPTRYPLLPLDRIMCCGQAELGDATAHDSPLARRASDHLPVKARLRFRERLVGDERLELPTSSV